MATRQKELLPAQDNAHAREVLIKLIEAEFDGNQRAAAKALGVTQPALSLVVNNKGGVGAKLITAICSRTGMSVDQLLGRVPETVTVPLERYPNRARAIALLVESGDDEVECREAAPVALDSDEDPDPLWWVDQIRSELARRRRGIRVGVRTVGTDEGI
jgi:transcriptional regulator with XRE-family HTH domain